MLASTLGRMSRRGISATHRTKAIARHMMTTNATDTTESPVLFESNLALRTYVLNRPKKLNALDETMLNLLRPKIEEWSRSELCGTIVGTGAGRAFCAGGDVAGVVKNAAEKATRPLAIDFFKREFEMDYILATLEKPYVVIMDGVTMGGGVGLAAPAQFRIATEKTVFAMPETKIGYCPDVGANYFLSRLDGEIGTYLALTSDVLKGRQVFEHGLATHFIPSRRIPELLDRLAALEKPLGGPGDWKTIEDIQERSVEWKDTIDTAIEELHYEREPGEPPAPFTGAKRVALDAAFCHDQVEKIIHSLKSYAGGNDATVSDWAKETLSALHMRSPTSLKVALQAIRKGKGMSLLEALQMELRISTAFCSGASPDFRTGVSAVLIDKNPADERPAWSPSTLEGVSDDWITTKFFDNNPFTSLTPELVIPEHMAGVTATDPRRYSLPTEEDVREAVLGLHKTSGKMGITLPELIIKFEKLRPGKHGVREKVEEIAKRKCDLVDNADGNYRWLKWKH